MTKLPRDRTPAAAILREGCTCARIGFAQRVAVAIDAESYYRALLDAFRRARRRIAIVGWDFDPRVRLDPADETTELRRLLPALLEARPELHVHVLVWDVAPLYGPSATLGPLFDRDWHDHSRAHFRFDGHHPAGAAHHEKIVCVDDVLAFVGGIDLTVCRWDTRGHAPSDPRRTSPDGERYAPVHDLQMAVDGDAARAVAQVVGERWVAAGGAPIAPCDGAGDVWPASLPPRLLQVPVGVARTRPRLTETPDVDEVARLNDTALRAVRRRLYIETQYLTAEPVADRLVDLLQRDDPPEIVILVWEGAIGWLERFAMGRNRERTLRRLAAADRRGRLRVFKLTAPGDPGLEVMLHAKLILVDDRFVRIGSSNLNNRSLGVDTECDLAIEAHDARTAAAVAGLRDDLLAEHLRCEPDDVRDAVAAHGLIGGIERLNARARTLVPYRIDPDAGPATPLPGTSLLDPAEPLDLDYLARRLRGHPR